MTYNQIMLNRTRVSRIMTLLLTVCLALSLIAGTAVSSYGESGSGTAHKTKYIAHRGLSAKAPENTLAAFRLAAKKKGFYGVEFDIWESKAESKKKDPLLLVMHDDNISRMCGRSKSIRSITRKTLKKYRIRSGNNIKKYRGQKIPTADRAISTIYRYSKGAIPVIELKHRLSKRSLKYLFKLIDGRNAVIISFDLRAVSDASRMAKKLGVRDNIQTMYLMDSLSAGKYSSVISKMKKADIDCLSLKYYYVSKSTVKRFHKAGLKVGVWTVPYRRYARDYAKMGVDYITANGVLY